MEFETTLYVLELALNATAKERLNSFARNSHVFINLRVTRLRQGCGCCGRSGVPLMSLVQPFLSLSLSCSFFFFSFRLHVRRRRLLANKFQYNVKPSNISSPAGGLQLFVQSKKSDMRNCDGIPHQMSITPGNLTHLFVNPSLFHLCISDV